MSTASKVLLHGTAKVEGERGRYLFSVSWQGWWASQMSRCEWLPFHPFCSSEKLAQFLAVVTCMVLTSGGNSFLSLHDCKPATYGSSSRLLLVQALQ